MQVEYICQQDNCKGSETVVEDCQFFDEHLVNRKCHWCHNTGNMIRRCWGEYNIDFYIKKEPRTVMLQAYRNSKELGRQEIQSRKLEKKYRRNKVLEEQANSVGGKLKKTDNKLPWWRDGSSKVAKRNEKPIDITKIKNLENYIKNGET